ncbi:MAG TPA: SPOR domain-containing protein, partial [Blastocatellia bacterium]
MHLEMTNKICALCKRLVATNGHNAQTRLCEECRSLIETILPNADSSPLSAVEQAQGVAQPQFATASMPQPAFAGHASLEEDMDYFEITPQPGRYELSSFDPVADFDELQAERAIAIETEYLDEFEASNDSASMPARALPDPAGKEIDRAGEPAEHESEVYIMFEQPEDLYDGARTFEPAPSEKLQKPDASRDEWPAQSIISRQPPQADARADFKAETSKDVEAEEGNDAGAIVGPEAVSYQAAVDPWDNPLPAWEQSRNEYPLYVGISERKSRWGVKTLLIPAALLAGLVVAYFIFQSNDGAPINEQAVVEPTGHNSERSLPVAVPQAPDQTKPAGGDAQQVAPTSSGQADEASPEKEASAEKKDAPVAGANASGAETQWRYSLQAMASQSEDEAGAFAERVRSAGIPAYVVSADIANRGRWFRVRVGGFSTAQEAQRFVAEARARA